MGRSRLFSKLAKDIDATGNLTAKAISSDVTLGGATVYANRSNLPVSGNTAGDQAYVTANNRLYIWNGSGWYNVALLNVAPAIQSIQDSGGNTTPFTLSNEGVVTTITITAADSDGDPITYSATADSDFNGLASITNAGNKFTITPFSEDSATTQSGTITFKATDGVNIASSGVQTFTLAFRTPLWSKTILSMGTSSAQANRTFIDRSTNARTITPTGTPFQTAFHPYLDNYSLYLDGSGDWLRDDTIGDEIQTAFEDSGVTIEFWAFPQFSDNGPVVIGSNSSSAGNEFLVQCDQLHLYSNGSFSTHTYSSGMNRYEWNHYVIQFDLNDSRRVSVWINGSRVLNMTRTGWFNIANNSFGFGTESDSGYWGNLGNYWNGYLFDMRITTGPVYGDVNTIDVPTTVQPTLQDTFVHIFKSNNWSNEGRTWQDTGGTPTTSSYTPFGQKSEYAPGQNKGSAYFDNTDDGVVWTPSAIGTNDFTIEFWAYSTDGNGSVIVDWRPTSTNGRYIFIGYNGSTDGTIDTVIDNITYQVTSANLYREWCHIAFVRESGVSRFYINGEAGPTLSNTTDYLVGVGRLANGAFSASAEFRGYISDFRVNYDTALYTANFTPPTAPVGNTNADLYLPMDNPGMFDKTGNHTFRPTNNLSTSATRTKFADTSIYFANNSGILYWDGLGFGKKFTIEFWFNPVSVDSSQGDNFININGAIGMNIGGSNNPQRQRVYYFGSQVYEGTSGGYPAGQWTHIAITRDSSNVIRFFQNGTELFSVTRSNDISAGPSQINATSNARYLYAYIENFQIIDGVAKYTSNFTVPDREQGITYQAED